jgi:hypothetical protein
VNKPKSLTLALYSIRVRPDQLDFLKGLPNASEWIRRAIDEARVGEPAASSASRIIMLSQQIRDVSKQIEVLGSHPNYLEAKRELEQRERLQYEMQTLSAMYEHPDNLMPIEEHAITGTKYALWIPAAKGGGRRERIEAETCEELMRVVKAKIAHNLDELTKKKQNSLAQDETKTRIIVDGFEKEIQAFSGKRRALEEELLRESPTLEHAEGGTGGTP